MNHYTNRRGYNGIRATSPWCFKARRQRTRSKPFGAYFTTLVPTDPNFVRRVRLPKVKREYRFSFTDIGDLLPIPGPGGKEVFYSPQDYSVDEPRQLYCGLT
jgi:hypothetical protein